MAELLRGGSGENGTCIWDIMGCELGIEIQLQVQEKRDVWGIGRPARGSHNKQSTWLHSHVTCINLATCSPRDHDGGTFSHLEDFDRGFKKKDVSAIACSSFHKTFL